MSERPGSMSADTRAWLLVGVASLLAVALVGVYLAAGGATYEPSRSQDPCKPRPWRNPQGIEAIAEQFSLSALDGAACKLGVSRETLARALATPEARARFARRYGINDRKLAEAVRAGLLRAIDDAQEAGALSPFLAAPLREVVRRVPMEQAIEFIRDARSFLEEGRSFLGPAQGLLEQFLP